MTTNIDDCLELYCNWIRDTIDPDAKITDDGVVYVRDYNVDGTPVIEVVKPEAVRSLITSLFT